MKAKDSMFAVFPKRGRRRFDRSTLARTASGVRHKSSRDPRDCWFISSSLPTNAQKNTLLAAVRMRSLLGDFEIFPARLAESGRAPCHFPLTETPSTTMAFA